MRLCLLSYEKQKQVVVLGKSWSRSKDVFEGTCVPRCRVQGSTEQWVEQGTLGNLYILNTFTEQVRCVGNFPFPRFFFSKTQYASCVVSHSTPNCNTVKIYWYFSSILLITLLAHFFHLFCTSQFLLHWTKLSSFSIWAQRYKMEPWAVLSLAQIFAWHNHTHNEWASVITAASYAFVVKKAKYSYSDFTQQWTGLFTGDIVTYLMKALRHLCKKTLKKHTPLYFTLNLVICAVKCCEMLLYFVLLPFFFFFIFAICIFFLCMIEFHYTNAMTIKDSFTITSCPAVRKETKCDQPLSRRLCIIHQGYIGLHSVGQNRAGRERTQPWISRDYR